MFLHLKRYFHVNATNYSCDVEVQFFSCFFFCFNARNFSFTFFDQCLLYLIAAAQAVPVNFIICLIFYYSLYMFYFKIFVNLYIFRFILCLLPSVLLLNVVVVVNVDLIFFSNLITFIDKFILIQINSMQITYFSFFFLFSFSLIHILLILPFNPNFLFLVFAVFLFR